MNEKIKERAYAKLNISLDVSKPRGDGYHDMLMVMQAISLCDDLTITLTENGKVSAESNLTYIPGDERNLAVKAAKRYFQMAGLDDQGASIHIQKRIPVGAGMAGGSSDAAAVLRGLNAHFRKLTTAELFQAAEYTGSDVAFCLAGGTALAEGRGEILTHLPALPMCNIVVCKPEFAISTPELFHALDAIKLRRHPDTAGIRQALDNGDLKQVCRRMYNVFEDVPDRRMKVVSEIKKKLIDAGAEGAIMTGTGSAVFGIFTEEKETDAVCKELKKEIAFVCKAKPVGIQHPLP